jgi:hypothetical protein
VQIDNRITATMHAWNVPNTDFTPTLDRTLRLIYTVMLETNLGLPQVAHLIDFDAKKIRSHLVEQLRSPLIQREWRELQGLSVKDWRAELLSAKNKLFKFLTSPTLGRFMGVSGRTLNLQEIMDQGKILLVNLKASDDLSHPNARAFGALLVNEFFECALRRQEEGSKPYYLYIDEFQNFVSLDIANMLDEVRKFGLFVVASHQRFGQLEDDIIDAILVNAKIKAVFGGLDTKNARRMAEEMFIGNLDPKKIKAAIYQTKFWPEYRRDKVYTTASARSGGTSSGESSGAGSGFNTTTGEFFEPGDWFSGSVCSGSSIGESRSSFSFSGSGSSTSESFSETDGVADVPIFVPVPFRELSSLQYYSPEEQLIELTAALKLQYGRHCFIQIDNQKTQPMLVPFVRNFYTSMANQDWYKKEQLRKHGALLLDQVDQLLESQEDALLKASHSEEVDAAIIQAKSTRRSKTRKRSARESILATIKEPTS